MKISWNTFPEHISCLFVQTTTTNVSNFVIRNEYPLVYSRDKVYQLYCFVYYLKFNKCLYHDQCTNFHLDKTFV